MNVSKEWVVFTKKYLALQQSNESERIGFLPKKWLEDCKNKIGLGYYCYLNQNFPDLNLVKLSDTVNNVWEFYKNKITVEHKDVSIPDYLLNFGSREDRVGKININRYLTSDIISYVNEIYSFFKPDVDIENEIEYVSESVYNLFVDRFGGDNFVEVGNREVCLSTETNDDWKCKIVKIITDKNSISPSLYLFPKDYTFGEILVFFNPDYDKDFLFDSLGVTDINTPIDLSFLENQEEVEKIRANMQRNIQKVVRHNETLFILENEFPTANINYISDNEADYKDSLSQEKMLNPSFSGDDQSAPSSKNQQSKKEDENFSKEFILDEENEENEENEKNENYAKFLKKEKDTQSENIFSYLEYEHISQTPKSTKKGTASVIEALLNSNSFITSDKTIASILKNMQKDISTFAVKIQNYENSCYINTAIQCLISYEPFNKLILTNPKKGKITNALYNLMNDIIISASIEDSVQKEKIKQFKNKLSLLNQSFARSSEQDISELVTLLIDKLKEEFSDSENKVSKMFYSKMESHIGKDNFKDEIFNIIPLTIQFKDTLKEISVKFFYYNYQKENLLIKFYFRVNASVRSLKKYLATLLAQEKLDDDWLFVGIPFENLDKEKDLKIFEEESVRDMLDFLSKNNETEILCFQKCPDLIPMNLLYPKDFTSQKIQTIKANLNENFYSENPLNKSLEQYTTEQNNILVILTFFSFDNFLEKCLKLIPLLIDTKKINDYTDLHKFLFTYLNNFFEEDERKLSLEEYIELLEKNEFSQNLFTYFSEHAEIPFILIDYTGNPLRYSKEKITGEEKLAEFSSFSLAKISVYVREPIQLAIQKVSEKEETINLVDINSKNILEKTLDEEKDKFAFIEDCISDFFTTSMDSKEGKKVEKKYKIISLPEVLIFQITRNLGEADKNKTMLSFPMNLNLKEYYKNPQQDETFELIATANHVGSNVNSGHFYAKVKRKDCWYNISDDIITVVNNNYNSKKDKTEVYLLFYKKV